MKTIVDTTDTEIGFLEDVDISNGYVSIVTRGANQIPFTIVKTQESETKKKEETMKKGARVAKTLIAPKGTTTEVIQSVFGEHLNLGDRIETSKYDIYSLLDPELFAEDSLQLFKVQEGEVQFRVVAGTLQKAPEGETILGTIRQKAAPVSVLQVSEELEAKDLTVAAKEMSWELYDEVSALASGISAVLSQKTGSGDEKLGMVQGLWANFEAYCAETLATLQAKAAEPIEARPEAKVEETKLSVEKSDGEGEEAQQAGGVGGSGGIQEPGEKKTEEEKVESQEASEMLEILKGLSARMDGFDAALGGVKALVEEMEALKQSVHKIQTEGIPARMELPGDPPKGQKKKEQKSGRHSMLENMSIYQPIRR